MTPFARRRSDVAQPVAGGVAAIIRAPATVCKHFVINVSEARCRRDAAPRAESAATFANRAGRERKRLLDYLANGLPF
jgi:hypothetical protein